MSRTYRMLRKLGQGAFGEVHLAEVRDEGDGFSQILAVKWLHAQYSMDTHLAGRLRDEARLLALLNHDHIVRVHGLTRIEGRLAVLMEPVEGIDLSELSGESVPPAAALQVIAAVADALAAAWNARPAGASGPLRVVHRDIKPSNIMVTAHGGVKVMDFGVARASFDAREVQTRSQQFGTARYMAPERWLEGVSEAPSDIYSLGITLVELAGGIDVERMRLSERAFEEDLDRAVSYVDEVEGLGELIRQMCAFEPEARPHALEVASRCRELASQQPGDDLRTWAAHRCVRSEPAGQATTDQTIHAEDGSADTFAVTSEFATAPTPLTVTAPVTDGTPATAPKLASTADLSADLARRPGFLAALLSLLIAAVLLGIWLGPYMNGNRRAEGQGFSEPAAMLVAEPANPEPLAAAPAPPPDPTPVVDPTPAVEPAPSAAPGPAPALPAEPTQAARPTPAPVAAPAPAPQGTVTFVLEPPDLVVQTDAGRVRTRRAVSLDVGPQRVRVLGPGPAWECTIPVPEGHVQYAVRADGRRCIAMR